MIKFTTPANLNGTQLINELKVQGVAISESPTIDGNGDLFLDIVAKDEIKAKAIVAAHVGVDNYVNPEKAALLAKLGITADEAKLLLS